MSEAIRVDADTLRFRLGTSLVDAKIPFAASGSFRRTIDDAFIDAYLRVAQRHRASIVASELDELNAVESIAAVDLKPATFLPPPGVTREGERRAYAEAGEWHVGVDGAVVGALLAAGRPARRFHDALGTMFTKARDEGSRSETSEPTGLVLALVLRTLLERGAAVTQNSPVSEPMARFLRSAAATIIAQLVHATWRDLQLSRDAGLVSGPPSRGPMFDANAAAFMLASVSLPSLVGAKYGVSGSGVSAWGIAFEAPPPRLEDVVARLAKGDDVDAVVRDVASGLQRENDVRRRLERAAVAAQVREALRMLARLLEAGRTQPFVLGEEGSISGLVVRREGVERLISQDPRRQDFARALRSASRQLPAEAVRVRFEQVASMIGACRDDEPGAGLPSGEARSTAARAIVALAADTLLDRLSQSAAQILLERPGDGDVGDASEYESGRVYLVCADERPILRARTRAPLVAHLFADMKDFTRRTTALKETVIADYLHREFYAPILTAASSLDPGGPGAEGRPVLVLNNLLGDAVSFSGEITRMMTLARRIQNVLVDSARRLEGELSKGTVAEKLRELEAQHRRTREAIERNIRELVGRAPFATPEKREEMLARAQDRRADLARLDTAHELERSRAGGERLEAGIFVSFGAAPEIVRLEDPVFGLLRVSIAEKINESARGTARTARVRTAVQHAHEAARRNSARLLENPFYVWIDEGEIYNAGAAASGETVEAYLAARAGELSVARLTVPVAELNPAFRQRFFFRGETLSLILTANPLTRSPVDLLVHSGRALFKGFEATEGLDVYEIVDASSPFFQLFAAYHAADALAALER